MPVTVIVGEHDAGSARPPRTCTPPIAESELVVIPGAAHSPQDEQPAAWLGAVRAHLARAEATTS